MGRTLFDKIWDAHVIADLGDGDTLLYIDRVFLHERTGSIALQGMAENRRAVRTPRHVFCTMDHIVDTFPGRGDDTLMPGGKAFITTTRKAALAAGIRLFDLGDPRQGIMHVVAPELGIALPGLTMVCPDSHSCTLGGVGTLAWGIGSTEAEHAMATGTLRLRKPASMRVNLRGEMGAGVTAKDLVLHLIAEHSTTGGAGHAIEFAGPVVDRLSVEARLTLCNMAVEFSAFTGLVAPDRATLDYLRGRTFAPTGALWEVAEHHWHSLASDADAVFDRELEIECSAVRPTVTWGTSPQHAVTTAGRVPDPGLEPDPGRQEAMRRALEYMALQPGTPMADIRIDAAFIGSCTNSRLDDLRAAAAVLDKRQVAPWVKAVCVPGSTQVKRAAESEGLDRAFTAAGFEWRESGCSMCLYAGGETFGPGQRVISSTNRNFEGRQGPGTRTHIASPATVAASACAGYIRAAGGA
ncbi:MAG: 3-isopropylmalate dehydratase large subunit [Xanthomonadales bacterium]|nr:3-isopropylmalate dehydratase large subunit [Xanthomonadales bacterium]NIN60560.1 3-isopropylmalate dehydratase large subunit [Xanthomonadales bacterium]NIN75912.1 3-isopropylmalate dehydratase large subunit [Xanthomonadales bacterium]NIO15004.1 3-isopropylmalate dehydratase large subunit [Xanthomonadales bacterium]NIP12953.1 3-isopropylmalate dehydratase large subunit [Xanthomonadales bacterium]